MQYRSEFGDRKGMKYGHATLDTGLVEDEAGEGAIVAGVIGTAIVATLITPILYAGFGALFGEILDHVPYFDKAVPQGIDSMMPGDQSMLAGNIDKMGAALGFGGSFFRSGK